MSTIILLNGCGSSGKTSIAKNIQLLSDKPWLHFAMDAFIDMMPDEYCAFGKKASEGYFSFTPGSNESGVTMRVENGPLGAGVFGAMPEIAKILADLGNNLVIDEVLLDEESLHNYVVRLKGHNVHLIGVFCDLHVLMAREELRTDRVIGLSNDQYNRVHAGARYYDFKVDTTSKSSSILAKEILTYMNEPFNTEV